MSRIPIENINSQDTVEDTSHLEDPFLIKFYRRTNIKGIGVYVRREYFSHLDVWDKHILGKHIRKILLSSKFGKYIKCVFFDSSHPDMDNLGSMNAWLKSILQLSFMKEDQENILLYTLCTHCENICTIKHHMDNLSEFLTEHNACKSCYYGI